MRRLLSIIAVAIAAIVPAGAQTYPEHPITLVVPFAVGGGTDIFARQLAARLPAELGGQRVIVENKVGAGGTIGGAAVAGAAPDGYTVLLGTTSVLAISPSLYKNLPYDPAKAFSSVSLLTTGPFVLAVRQDLPVRNVQELVEYARRNPGKLNYGSAGLGTVHHLAAELLKQATGIDMVHVPYKGGGPAWAGLAAGDIHLMLDSMPGPMATLQAGRARAIAVTGPQRLASLPDIPTYAEQGFRGIDVTFFYAVVVPAGTPHPAIARLNAAFRKTMEDPTVREALQRQSLEPRTSTPKELDMLLAENIVKWRQVVEKAGIKLE